MGVLDDAIREHLDLKRRHGVAEEELRRQEEEALGPARRELAPEEAEEDGAAAVDGAAEAAPEEAPLAESDEPELSEMLPETALHSDLHDEELDEEELPLDEPTDAHAPVEEAPARAETPAAGFEELDEDELLDEEEPPAEEELHGHEDLAPGEPADDGLEDEAEGGDGDLLEDTPDFLEETPEHDRLWFEQKPPRDFDFD